MPGTSCKAILIFSDNSLKVVADVHCDLSFKIIIISLASIGIGSVGTSPLPIFVTTIFTSGNFDLRICAAFCVLSIVVFKLLPVKTRVSTAKSPSSSAGINSPPKNDSVTIAIINSPITDPITILGTVKILFKVF